MTDIKSYNPIFKRTYQLLEKHLNADTHDDFGALMADLDTFAEPFEVKLAGAVLFEIERLYKERHTTKNSES